MKIKSFRLTNYKCFDDSGEISLGPGFNVIVGQNNVGKTALIEALSFNFSNRPHRSLRNERNAPIVEQSYLDLRYTHESKILKKFILSQSDFWFFVESGRQGEYQRSEDVETIFEKDALIFSHRCTQGGGATLTEIEIPWFCLTAGGNSVPLHVKITSDRKKFHSLGGGGSGAFLGDLSWALARRDTYKFNAERLNISTSGFGDSSVLESNARNLPLVLLKLQSDNPSRYDRLNNYIRRLFPSVHHVAAGPNSQSAVELRAWIAPTKEERSDLAISLAECGTGIGQVLAMLYVVLTSDTPQCILIDEPNSFLHPGATKKLIEILKNYPQHQYIVSTHSAEVIRAANPDVVLHLRWDGSKSIVNPIEATRLRSMRDVLLDLGVSLGDVFGPDAIIWVEGDTEEKIYPEIVRRLLKRDLMGIAFCGITATGDFQQPRKKARLVKDIYEKISKGLALIPEAASFSFDREGLTEEDTAGLMTDFGSNLHFLPRVNIESYLLHPKAITHVLNSLETFRQSPVADGAIQEWIHMNEAKPEFHKRYKNGTVYGQKEWFCTIDGAKLLTRLFGDISEQKEEFRKVQYSVALANWIMDNDSQWLDGLKEYVASLLPVRSRVDQIVAKPA